MAVRKSVAVPAAVVAIPRKERHSCCCCCCCCCWRCRCCCGRGGDGCGGGDGLRSRRRRDEKMPTRVIRGNPIAPRASCRLSLKVSVERTGQGHHQVEGT